MGSNPIRATDRELLRLYAVRAPVVKTHVARILDKLDVRDRVQAVVAAYENGIVTPGVA